MLYTSAEILYTSAEILHTSKKILHTSADIQYYTLQLKGKTRFIDSLIFYKPFAHFNSHVRITNYFVFPDGREVRRDAWENIRNFFFRIIMKLRYIFFISRLVMESLVGR